MLPITVSTASTCSCFVRVSVSPDSGISSLPSPVSLPDNCLAMTDTMVLRSHRLVRSAVASSRRCCNIELGADLSPELSGKLNS